MYFWLNKYSTVHWFARGITDLISSLRCAMRIIFLLIQYNNHAVFLLGCSQNTSDPDACNNVISIYQTEITVAIHRFCITDTCWRWLMTWYTFREYFSCWCTSTKDTMTTTTTTLVLVVTTTHLALVLSC